MDSEILKRAKFNAAEQIIPIIIPDAMSGHLKQLCIVVVWLNPKCAIFV